MLKDFFDSQLAIVIKHIETLLQRSFWDKKSLEINGGAGRLLTKPQYDILAPRGCRVLLGCHRFFTWAYRSHVSGMTLCGQMPNTL